MHKLDRPTLSISHGGFVHKYSAHFGRVHGDFVCKAKSVGEITIPAGGGLTASLVNQPIQWSKIK